MYPSTSLTLARTSFPALAGALLDVDHEGLCVSQTQGVDLSPPVAVVHSMRRCPKFSCCSASLCPLDPRWAERVALPGEPTCTWFLEMAKEGPESQYVPDEIREEVAHALKTMLTSHGTASLRVAVRRASKSGSRRRNAARLLQMEAEESATVH